MDMSQAFPGQHLKAADLAGQTIVLTIASIAMAKIGDDEKPVMKFYETQQDMVLNKTNTNVIIASYGSESNAWAGRQLQLYPTKVQFGAEMVDAIRVQVPAAPAAAVAPVAVAAPVGVPVGVPVGAPAAVAPVGVVPPAALAPGVAPTVGAPTMAVPVGAPAPVAAPVAGVVPGVVPGVVLQ